MWLAVTATDRSAVEITDYAERLLAGSCALLRRENNTVFFSLDPGSESYLTRQRKDSLARRLSDYFGEPLVVDIRIGVADPPGAAMYSHFVEGEIKSEGNSITEGIGLGRVTPIIEDITVDCGYRIPDEESLPILFELLQHEALCLGGSSDINVAGAIRLAKELGPGHTIVTVLCDYGTRYQSRLFNPEFLSSKGYPLPPWLV